MTITNTIFFYNLSWNLRLFIYGMRYLFGINNFVKINYLFFKMFSNTCACDRRIEHFIESEVEPFGL